MGVFFLLIIAGIVLSPLLLVFIGFIRYIMYKSGNDENYKNGAKLMLVGVILFAVEILIGLSICSNIRI